ncbi:aminopeptidase [Flammeovirga kamogawensis]|uniref:Aminopeptidase n=2 Tax=Flammeovirga kamogawensis TaxID=373891 RepID=A0ABX8GRJ7_9BACT|nr:aminopeptidase [Flammeovirga kamogawensis]TRX68026.1 aminopeptidase [Flammeovirga kamogawensis]
MSIKQQIWYWFKRVILLLFIGMIAFLGYYHKEATYGIRQGLGQLDIMFNAKPLDVYLADTSFTEEQKSKIRLIQEIRQFTVDSLGLDKSNSYTKLYNQHGNPILWTVTACAPFNFEAKRWSFPIFGTFSYKGFFDKQLAKQARDKLRDEGFDAEVGEVSAWSTLGVLNDPILSNMLNRNVGSLSRLIIHELTHGTLYVKNSVSYNENLADFVGDEGAKRFLIYKYGRHSIEYVTYMARKEDRKVFSEYILKGTKELDSLYLSFPESMSVDQKNELKNKKISEITKGIQHLQFANDRYCDYFSDFTPNNTFFMGFKRYRGKQNEFKEEFDNQFNGDFHAYMTYLKETYKPLF